MKNVKKVDDHTISVDTVKPSEIQTVTYLYDNLVSQRNILQEQLNEVNDLITQADNLGVSSSPITVVNVVNI